MKIKRLLLPAILCGVTIALSPALFAQDSGATTGSTAPAPGGGGGGKGRMSVDDRLAGLTKALDLTADQQAKIKPILQDQADKMKAVFSDSSIAKADRGAKMKEIRDATDTAIKAVLTPDQVTKFEALIAKRGAGRGGNGGGGGGGGGQ
jgi:Spy/CpxP family protein refolding chaperone